MIKGRIPEITDYGWTNVAIALDNRQSSISMGSSAKLVVEVVSTNWQDDYAHKLADYEQLGIPEYWIVDYLGLGGVRYIGSPKQPTITVYSLIDGEYIGERFCAGDRLTHPTLRPCTNKTIA
jgi:Uma2 family endonuclease